LLFRVTRATQTTQVNYHVDVIAKRVLAKAFLSVDEL